MLSVEDRLDIGQLYAEYAHRVDTGDVENWTECFTPEGYLDSPWYNARWTGPEELATLAREFYATFNGLYRHLYLNIMVNGDGDAADGACYFIMLQGGSESHPPRIAYSGKYEDRIVRTRDGWRFAARVARIDAPAAESGPLPWVSPE